MPLLIGLGFYFLGALAIGLVYNFLIKRRRAVEALHLSAIFALAVTAGVFILAVGLDLLNVTPEPPAG